MHLLKSGEFLNVGLFCRVSCCHARDGFFFSLSTPIAFFSFDIFMHFFFFWSERDTIFYLFIYLLFFFFLRSCYIFMVVI